MLLNQYFAIITILSCVFLFFLIVELCFLTPEVVTQTFNPIAELVIPIEIPTKEAKVETETHLVIVEITISVISAQYNSKLYKLFYASYSLTHFDLFLQ